MRAHAKRTPAARAVDAVRGSGKPLPPHVQREAFDRYGFGFGHVRVHDGPPANAAAKSLHASAYTIGSDIAFAAGRYAPEAPTGRALLRHELRHVAQQHWAAASLNPQVDARDSAHERDAREPSAQQVPALAQQRIQRAPEEEEQFSLGTGLVDTVGRKATSDRSWPFIKAVLEGFVGGLKSDVKSGRADAAKSHLSELMRPWNAVKFYGGYLVGLVIGLVSPITDLVKGVVGLVKLGVAGLDWLAKWSPLGIAISAERRAKVAQLNLKLGELMGELGTSLAAFVTDPKGTVQKFSGFLEGLMQMALSKARSIGAGGAHALFDFLGKDFYEMGKGIGEVIGTLIAQVLLLVFSEAIGNLIAKGASLVGKAAEFVAGKAVEAFTWLKGIFVEAVGLLRGAVKGALKAFEGVVNKAVEAFEALVGLFSEAAVVGAGEKAAAGVGRGAPGPLPNVMESRMVTSTRTSPATVADLKPPKVHPSNVGKEASVAKPAAEAPKSSPAATKAETLTPDELRRKHVLEEFTERQELEQKAVLQEQESKHVTRTRKQAGVSLEEDHHIATRYLSKNKALFESAGTHVDADLNLIKEFPEHGQLRGWYDWKGRSYRFNMRGHHPEYNRWVTETLGNAVPPGLSPDVALSRIMNMNARLEAIIRAHPEVLSHGPDILPAALRKLTF
ncbi:eCIS core domain-containing protein [Variovorax sp. RA8]|uniref:eCIS core domain-containing protein n=1 Tax=Variovorax sp. (strain JCM 16519 / RA8) TaxID=662548 RepID=UPI00131744BA|nr:DUF4157 domain-containing protein [Variovorax sp. RA8]VTU28760.1 hypothetical protein RA8CHR_03815 [Variovorax sp. RA8]